jgi:transcriptional regulator
LVFLGPHGYISPSWFTDRTQAPAWNFALVKLEIEVELDRSAEAAREAVDRLTAHMEQGRPNAWSPREMGDRYGRLIPAVVAFRVRVRSMQAKFKLGQNERMDVLTECSLRRLHSLRCSPRCAGPTNRLPAATPFALPSRSASNGS